MRLHMKPTEIGKVVHAAADVVRPAAEAKHITIDCRLDDEAATAVISADPDRLQQVFWNLLSNALKFTPRQGKVEVTLSRVESHIEVSVSDSGPGISPEIKPHIFEPFFTTKGVGQGTGLGLDTVQRLVKKHRGNIQVTSKPGDTRFQVWLPLAGVPS